MKHKYNFSEEKFIIENYNYAKTFSSFLPGIAGELGLPLWSFYVNRGQGICSFGVGNKEHPILEFFPADQAYQNVSTHGFRTFLKIDNQVYEPFLQTTHYPHKMIISYEKLQLIEENQDHGVKVTISYTTLANHDFPGLIRKVEFENLSEGTLNLEILDGLPRISPYGVNAFSTKMMSYTSQAWMEVENLDQNIPFYKIKAGMDDTQNVEEINAGNFYICLDTDGRVEAIVDPDLVFGSNKSLTHPLNFESYTLQKLYQAKQVTFNKIPCGFFGKAIQLKEGQNYILYSLIGHAPNSHYLNSELSKLTSKNLEDQFLVNYKMIEDLSSSIGFRTGIHKFDNYAKNSYLDNILRGGFPLVINSSKHKLPIVYHMFFRKHGDLERDYNDFYLAPEFYSQGNGNYRDINQNRRLDVIVNPEVSYYNILSFINLIQADGYNPLVLTGNSFIYKNDPTDLNEYIADKIETVYNLISKKFTPGSLLRFVRENDIPLLTTEVELVHEIIARSIQIQNSVHGEGYWVDHFGYNIDLIENYLLIFPDREFELLFEINQFTYHDSDVMVNPISERLFYVDKHVIQKNSVYVDKVKTELLQSRNNEPNLVRIGDKIYRTTLYNKLITLVLIKFSTMDPWGYGIEMEAGKPGWYDALNGLPGLIGSSATDTLVLKQFVDYLIGVSEKYELEAILIPQEVHDLATEIHTNLQISDKQEYWANNVISREHYRERSKYGFSELTSLDWLQLQTIIRGINDKLEKSIAEMIQFSNGNIPTYFYYDLINSHQFLKDYQLDITPDKYHKLRFKINSLPLFLEGFVKGLNLVMTDEHQVYMKIMESELFDAKLKMFKVNENLELMSYKIGRAHSFVRGWLENESIWMHMEYKFLLALLKSGLYNEFYKHLSEIFIPFLDPEIYGRSTLENSSFIVSSSFPDDGFHGRGYYARLSGVTIEALNIIFLMFMGPEPYRFVEKSLIVCLEPILPHWLFGDERMVKFILHGKTRIIYHNHKQIDTDQLQIQSIEIDGQKIKGSIIPEPYSRALRAGEIEKINIDLN